ncbi:MAG: hypothetical protein SOU18_02305 [Alloprevotella sp.]|nr:hypothetical protein [Alloprevotella sp.]
MKRKSRLEKRESRLEKRESLSKKAKAASKKACDVGTAIAPYFLFLFHSVA